MTQVASNRNLIATGMANLPVPPRTTFGVLGVAILEKPPFTLAAKVMEPAAVPGKAVTFLVTATRVPEFKGEIALSFVGLAPGMTAAPAKIAADQKETKVEVKLTPAVKPGAVLVTVRGTAKHGASEFNVGATPVTVNVMAPKK
jgi:hypothetical protein